MILAKKGIAIKGNIETTYWHKNCKVQLLINYLINFFHSQFSSCVLYKLADNRLMIKEINNLILKTAPKHIAADIAPSTAAELFARKGSMLVVWNGGSDNTIFGDATVNWAFRALHDALHLKTGLGFTVQEEIELGRIQANQYNGLMADLVYIEVAKQAEYYLKNGVFIRDQTAFTIVELKKLGYSLK